MIGYGENLQEVELVGRLVAWEPRWDATTPYIKATIRTSGSHGRLLPIRSVWNRVELLDAFGSNAEIRVAGWVDENGMIRLTPVLKVLEK